MRLLHTKRRLVHDFTNKTIPNYAILSHAWDEREITFTDIQNGGAEGSAGYKKLNMFAEIAAQHGYVWVWMDTCCIDKSSNAELSRSYNSMYKRYRRADVCFVYLKDVNQRSNDSLSLPEAR